MSSSISSKDQKILWGRSGNRCAMPECRTLLVLNRTDKDREAIIGEMAHIKGENPTAARYDASMSDNERNGHDNLILLCGNHHKMIDDQPNTYTAEKLKHIKAEHEGWIQKMTEEEIVNVTFSELDAITKYLITVQPEQDDSLVLVPPKDKINKNSLSGKTEKLITTGLMQVKQVANFIDKHLDVEFGERLKQGFVTEYKRLKNEEKLSGDELFEALFEFASNGRKEFTEMAAGLAVLTYLFEQCEVFEK
ncbi:MAG: hypothetical protein PHU49_00315 [Syntrophorhabdaceae bacterium]|nr:HNH endonuclease [Candidatus Paceibacterota bacterium]MDD5242435.1 hypothetical protein [Syntrophorhabdaceae bacterium]